MFADELPEFARARTARVAAGLGAIARVVSEGQEIYARKLTFAEARGADRGRAPALSRRAGAADRRGAARAHGFAILIDWHSMPAAAARAGGRDRPCDFVLGDRFGAACAGRADRARSSASWRPWATAWRATPPTPAATPPSTTAARPRRTHALQIEINRGALPGRGDADPTAGFARLKRRPGAADPHAGGRATGARFARIDASSARPASPAKKKPRPKARQFIGRKRPGRAEASRTPHSHSMYGAVHKSASAVTKNLRLS